METVALPRNPAIADVSPDTLLALGFLLVQNGVPTGFKCKSYLGVEGIPDRKVSYVPGVSMLLMQGFMFLPQDTPRAMFSRGDPKFFQEMGVIARKSAFGQVLDAALPSVSTLLEHKEAQERPNTVYEHQVKEFGQLVASPYVRFVPYIDLIQVDHEVRPGGGFFSNKPHSWMHWAVQKQDGETSHLVVEFEDSGWNAWGELDFRFDCEVEDMSFLTVNDILEAKGAAGELKQALFDQTKPTPELADGLFIDTAAKVGPWEIVPGIPRFPMNLPRKEALDLVEARLRQAGFEHAPRAMAALWLSRGMHKGDGKSAFWAAISEQKFAAALVARFGDLWPRYMQMQTSVDHPGAPG